MNWNVFEIVSKPFLTITTQKIELHDKASQREAYIALIGYVRDRLASTLGSQQFSAILDRIAQDVVSAIQNPSQADGVAVINGKHARDQLGVIQAQLDRLPTPDKVSLLISQLSAIIIETAYANSSDFEIGKIRYSAALHAEMTSYASWRTLRAFKATEENPLELIAQRFEQDRMRMITEAQAQIASANERVIDLQKQDIELQDTVKNTKALAGGLVRELKQEIAHSSEKIELMRNSAEEALETVRATQENFSVFRASLIEEVRGKETRQLWKERDVQNWEAFKVSSIVLAALLIAIPILGLICLDWVIATLRHIGDAAVAGIPNDATGTQLAVAAISRLVVITFPLVLYLWVIRLVVRFNSRSLLLHDDARQRQTMMDTYFLLVERNAATPEERGLVLNALFRPAPGHGSENVDPPKFTDLLPNVPKSS